MRPPNEIIVIAVDRLRSVGDYLRRCDNADCVKTLIETAFELRDLIATSQHGLGVALKTTIDPITWDAFWALAKAAHMIGVEEDPSVFMHFRSTLKKGHFQAWPGELKIVRSDKDQSKN